jgi:hypothetical protein
MDTILIKQSETFITIRTEEDIGGRGSAPSRSQKGVEAEAKRMHTICKKSSLFNGCKIGYSPIDWYDSCDSFQVPGARMGKSDRKVRDTSHYENDTPKAWEEIKSVQFNASVRNASPIQLGMQALGIRADIKEIQKMLKKNNGIAYVNENGKVTAEDERYNY